MKKTKAKSKKKVKWTITESFELNDGDILVYKTTKGGDYWSMRVWINAERRYFMKSLLTKDKAKAIRGAKELHEDILVKQRLGHQVFDKSMKQLVEMFLEEEKERIRFGEVGKGSIGITEGRYGTIKTHVTKHLLPFIGENTRVSRIRNDAFKHKYRKYRKKISRNVTDMSIIGERSTINRVFKYGIEKGILQHNQIPLWEEMRKEKSSRDSLTLSEWKEIYTYLRSWSKDDTDEKLIQTKEFIRNFILILGNAGLRFGECRFLKWKDIEVIKEKDGSFTSVIDVKVSKTGPRDGVIGRGGEYFKRIKDISNFTKPKDWVFANNDTGKQLDKKIYYKLWQQVLENTTIKDRLSNFTYYTLRHTYCTFRLLSGTDIYLLSRNMGTSVSHIEKTYGHVRLMDKRKYLTHGKKLTQSEKVLIDDIPKY